MSISYFFVTHLVDQLKAWFGQKIHGILLKFTSSLSLVNASTFSYTDILEVNGRILGRYTCQIRGPNDQSLSSAHFTVQGS